MDLAQLIESSVLDLQQAQRLEDYFWLHIHEIQDDPHDPDLDDLAPEMSASLLHLSFRIMGTADLPLTAKLLLHYYGADTSKERKRPFLVKPDSSRSK
jgi:hypothetical protein